MTDPKWWDLTIPQDRITIYALIELLDAEGCDRYVIGNEVGESGYMHWQVRVVFKKPHSDKYMKQTYGPMGWHVSPTKAEVRNFHYCEKEGKFYRSWEKALGKYAMIKLYPWQEEVIELLKEQDDRTVLVIIDQKGGHGKTVLGRHLQVTHQAEYIPVMDSAKDYMRMCMAKQGRGYCMDVPRSDSLKQAKATWAAVESIKNGHLWDDRYSFQEQWIDPPKMVIFTNHEPPKNALSWDRWQVYDLTDTIGDMAVLSRHTWSDDLYEKARGWACATA